VTSLPLNSVLHFKAKPIDVVSNILQSDFVLRHESGEYRVSSSLLRRHTSSDNLWPSPFDLTCRVSACSVELFRALLADPDPSGLDLNSYCEVCQVASELSAGSLCLDLQRGMRHCDLTFVIDAALATRHFPNSGLIDIMRSEIHLMLDQEFSRGPLFGRILPLFELGFLHKSDRDSMVTWPTIQAGWHLLWLEI
jgi:hypothetical protein